MPTLRFLMGPLARALLAAAALLVAGAACVGESERPSRPQQATGTPLASADSAALIALVRRFLAAGVARDSTALAALSTNQQPIQWGLGATHASGRLDVVPAEARVRYTLRMPGDTVYMQVDLGHRDVPSKCRLPGEGIQAMFAFDSTERGWRIRQVGNMPC